MSVCKTLVYAAFMTSFVVVVVVFGLVLFWFFPRCMKEAARLFLRHDRGRQRGADSSTTAVPPKCCHSEMPQCSC